VNDERLDTLLRTPLPAVEDAGFSGRVALRVARQSARIFWLETGALAICALLFLFFLPARPLAALAVQMTSQFANSLAAATACLGIVLSLFFLRFSAEE